MPLPTKEQYDKFGPCAQGFAQYWYGEQPGSELRGLKNPCEHAEWVRGQEVAAQLAQDSEE